MHLRNRRRWTLRASRRPARPDVVDRWIADDLEGTAGVMRTKELRALWKPWCRQRVMDPKEHEANQGQDAQHLQARSQQQQAALLGVRAKLKAPTLRVVAANGCFGASANPCYPLRVTPKSTSH